ncbi:hypothetical protein EV361DRAFT_929610 [Lentinula raphanica]|nr:hypothetical protein EV361DRAFT_929610 [Lentinula raphanica]
MRPPLKLVNNGLCHTYNTLENLEAFPPFLTMLATLSLCNLLSILQTLGDKELQNISYIQFDRFIRFARHLRAEISLNVAHTDVPPAVLPNHISHFLSNCLELPSDLITILWKLLRQFIWLCEDLEILPAERRLFDIHGSQIADKNQQIAFFMFYPPCNSCQFCQKPLSHVSRIPVVYFTRQGSFRAYSTSLRCISDTCKICYYHNYFVRSKEAFCFYYDLTVPSAIHFEQHAFIETALSELFTTCTLFAWVSSQNNAAIYNHSLANTLNSTEGKYLLDSKQVWKVFVLTSLLRDAYQQGRTLSFPDGGDQNSWMKEIMQERNNRIITQGQRERLHACSTCERFVETDLPGAHKGLRSLRAVVTDGVSLPRPCCKAHNCTEPLINNRHHWCKLHKSQHSKCAFQDCDRPIRTGYRTCEDDNHKWYEDYLKIKGKGFFLLRQRLQRAGVQAPDSIPLGGDTSEALQTLQEIDSIEMESLDPSHKSDKGNRPAKAMFARRRTHNEQLVVCSCGVIAARATMYGAESISGVKDFLKSVYPDQRDLPDPIFYDNNCQLQAHLQAQGDDYFQGVMLPVDVFHFKSKHKVSDEFCQRHCNPSQWKDLVGEDGSWVFNSSAAEQTNVWFGGYAAIVHEMLAHNCDFFLDEMILRRNEILVEKLRRNAKFPYHVPPAVLIDARVQKL